MTKANMAYVFLAMVGASFAAAIVTMKFTAPPKSGGTQSAAAGPSTSLPASSPAVVSSNTPGGASPATQPAESVMNIPGDIAKTNLLSPNEVDKPQLAVDPNTVAAVPDMALSQTLTPQAQIEARKQAHEQAARLALADIKSMMIRREFNKAADLARSAGQTYGGTQSACEFPNMLVECERELAAQREAEAVRAAMDQARAEADARARHQRFSRYRDEGVAAFNDRKYQAAILALQNALKEEDDPDAKALLDQAVDKTNKPRLSVAEFAVTGDIGITEAGKSISELLLGSFSQDRFQLVERSRLDAILNERDLTIAGVVDNPKLLTVKKVQGVRYLVVGTVSRLNTLAISARIVDASTGEVLQSCEMYAQDAASLQGCLPEVAAILEMTNEEKTAYLLDRRRRIEAAAAQADAEARAAAQRQLEEQMEAQRRERLRAAKIEFARRQHERDAVIALGDVKTLMGRGDWERALACATRAVRDFADTRVARDLVECQQQSAAGLSALRDAQARQSAEEKERHRREMEDRHRRFCKYRDDGATALGRKDYDLAISLFSSALKEEDSPDVKALMLQVQKQSDLVKQYQLAMNQGQTHFKSSQWQQSYDSYKQAYSLQSTPDAMSGMNQAAQKIQERQNLQRSYDQALRQAVTAAKSQNWTDALAAYQKADSIFSTRDTQSGIALATQKIQAAELAAKQAQQKALADQQKAMADQQKAEERRRLQAAYEQTLASALAAMKAEKWTDALAEYQKADKIQQTKETQNGIALATQKIQAAELAAKQAQQKALADQQKAMADQQKAEERRRLQAAYEQTLASALAAMKAEKWTDALAEYQKADKIQQTKETQNGIALATQKIQAAELAAKQKAALEEQQKAEAARMRLLEAARDKFRKIVQGNLAEGDTLMKQGKFAPAQREYLDAQKVLSGKDAAVLSDDERTKLLQEAKDKFAAAAKAAAEAAKPIAAPVTPTPAPVTPVPSPVKPATPIRSAPAPVIPAPTPAPVVPTTPTVAPVPSPASSPALTPGGPGARTGSTSGGAAGLHGPTSRPASRPAGGDATRSGPPLGIPVK